MEQNMKKNLEILVKMLQQQTPPSPSKQGDMVVNSVIELEGKRYFKIWWDQEKKAIKMAMKP